MDKKRAAIIASAGVGLLVSAIFLHTWQRKHRSVRQEEEFRAVVETDAEESAENEVV